MENTVRKAAIELKREQVRALRAELAELEDGCEHETVRDLSSARCNICGYLIGWWCKESSDHLCEYPERDFQKSCIHCGLSGVRL